jgi:hypothetical protein
MRRPGRIIDMGYPPIRQKGASCVSKVAHEEKAPAEIREEAISWYGVS